MYLFGYEPFDNAAFFNGFERKSCPECGSAEILRQCKNAVGIQRCFPLGCAGRSPRSLEQSSRAASGYTSPSWSWATRVSRKYLLWSVLSPLSSANMDSSRTRMPLNTKVAGDKPPVLGGSPFGPPMNVYHAVEVLRSNFLTLHISRQQQQACGRKRHAIMLRSKEKLRTLVREMRHHNTIPAAILGKKLVGNDASYQREFGGRYKI